MGWARRAAEGKGLLQGEGQAVHSRQPGLRPAPCCLLRVIFCDSEKAQETRDRPCFHTARTRVDMGLPGEQGGGPEASNASFPTEEWRSGCHPWTVEYALSSGAPEGAGSECPEKVAGLSSRSQ